MHMWYEDVFKIHVKVVVTDMNKCNMSYIKDRQCSLSSGRNDVCNGAILHSCRI